MPPPIHLHVTPNDDAPIYRQIVRQVVEGVAVGALTPGERLPSLRALAQRLVVAPLTVKKAYDVLESQGVVETRRGRGTFVAASAGAASVDALRALEGRVRTLIQQARAHGLSRRELLELVRRNWDGIGSENER